MAKLWYRTPNNVQAMIDTDRLIYSGSENTLIHSIKTFNGSTDTSNIRHYTALDFSNRPNDKIYIGMRSTPHDERTTRCKEICIGPDAVEQDTSGNGAKLTMCESYPDDDPAVCANICLNAVLNSDYKTLMVSYRHDHVLWRGIPISPINDSTKRWVKMNNRLIQWGTTTGTRGGGKTVPFSIEFSSIPIVIVLPRNSVIDANQQITQVSSRTKSNFVLHSMKSTYGSVTGAYNDWGVSWVAIGNC